MQFSSPDDFIAADNPVRIIDAFAEKPDPIAIRLQKTGIEQHSDGKKKTNPGGAGSQPAPDLIRDTILRRRRNKL